MKAIRFKDCKPQTSAKAIPRYRPRERTKRRVAGIELTLRRILNGGLEVCVDQVVGDGVCILRARERFGARERNEKTREIETSERVETSKGASTR